MPKLNPRRTVLAELRNVNRAMRWLVSRWDEKSTIYENITEKDADGRVRVTGYSWRPRRDDERIELNAQEWRNLATNLGDIMTNLDELHEFALAQAREIERSNRKAGI